MTAPTVTREQAFANARAVLDRARLRIAADYATGRLTPEQTAVYEQLRHRAAPAATAYRAAA